MSDLPAKSIGTLQENALHASLKTWYARPGDQVEAQVDGYWVDIVRGEQLLEIQTGNFSALRRKLEHFLPLRPLRVVYPLPCEKWIVRVGRSGETLARRKSPRRGQMLDIFDELAYLTAFLHQPHFSFEVLSIQQEDIWFDDGKGSWRRKGVSVIDRRLAAVLRSDVFLAPADYRPLLPAIAKEPFTVRDLARVVGAPYRRCASMAYCLRELGLIERTGKRGHSFLYRLT